MRALASALFAVGLAVILGGCSLNPDTPLSSDAAQLSWEQRQQQLLPLTHWQVLGKISIRTPEDSNSANLNWTQHDDHYRIYMAGPLGQGAVNIQGSEQQGITLDISGEERYQAASPEQLLQHRLGWSIPVSQMPYWVRGLPAPSSTHQIQLDTFNRISQLQQSGWSIRYLGYQPGHAEQPQLPRKIELKRGDQLRLLLVLKQWQFDLHKDA